MIRIGIFSELTGISIPMLRNYDKIGLLIPIHIEQESGYRYYDEEQIVIANQIQVLKRLGFGLKEIGTIVNSFTSNQQVAEFLKKKIVKEQEEKLEIERRIQRMQEAVMELEIDKSNSLSVAVKEIPARDVVSYRGIISRYEEEGSLWSILQQECKESGINVSNQEYSYAITHKIDLIKQYIDVEVQLPVSMPCNVKGRLKQKHIAPCKAVVFAFQGRYARLNEINPYMSEWIKKNRYRQTGPLVMVYYRSPGNESDPERYITEVCYPVDWGNI